MQDELIGAHVLSQAGLFYECRGMSGQFFVVDFPAHDKVGGFAMETRFGEGRPCRKECQFTGVRLLTTQRNAAPPAFGSPGRRCMVLL